MKTNICILILMLSLLCVFSKAEESNCIPSIYPVKDFVILEPGGDEKKMNEGIMLGTTVGSSVIAPADGVVKTVEKKENQGCVVTIDHGCGYVTRYVHLKENSNVKEGQQVKRNDIIGVVGDSGSKSKPFLYYEISQNGKPVNPFDVIMK